MAECGTESAGELFDKYKDLIEEDRIERMLEEFQGLCPVHKDVLQEGTGCLQCYQESAPETSRTSHPSQKQAWVGHPCQGKEVEERADMFDVVRVPLTVLLLCIVGLGQTAYSGKGQTSGPAASGVAAGSAPLTYAARADLCELGTETGPLGCAPNPTNPVSCPSCSGPATALPMAFNGSVLPGVPGSNSLPVPGPTGSTACGSQPSGNEYLCGANTTVTDPDLHGQLVRATDYSMNAVGTSFNLGSDGSLRRWASDSSKLMIVNQGNTGVMLAFNPANWGNNPVTLSSLAGGPVLGTGVLAFARTNPHILYSLQGDQENTVLGSVTSGTCVTPETMKQTGTNVTAKLQAINPAVLMQVGPASSSSVTATGAWTGQTSGCVFTPSSSSPVPGTSATTPNATTLYQGLINDATQPNPALWTITYSLLFNFNYVANMVGTAASYFPTTGTSCLPANYNVAWNGTFMGSDDDTQLAAVFSDNGQSSGWDSSHTGPVWHAVYKAGSGCRVWNTHTDQIFGDWGPQGQALDGQHNYVTGTISGTPAPGVLLTQASTGAVAEFVCPGKFMTAQTAPSGYTYNQFACGASSPNAWEIGLVYSGTADATHTWSDGAGNSLVPSALPVSVPFYYPSAVHDSSQTHNSAYQSIGLVQPGPGKITQVQGNTPTTGQTTITFAANYVGAFQDRQVVFYNLAGAHDRYLNCAAENQWCPAWNVVTGTAVTGGTSIVINDPQSSSYSDTESQSSCGTICPLLAPNGIGFNQGYMFNSDPNWWNTAGLTINVCINPSCQGHTALGYTGGGTGTQYAWHSYANPSLPCSVTGYTPCPRSDETDLLASIPEEQHGTYNNHGTQDLTPMFLSMTNVCGQPVSGPNGGACPAYTAAWESEIIGPENIATNGPGHCNYGSGTIGCTYRFAHTFNSNDSWNFNAQNNIGNVSPDGQWLAFPSTWMNTLGCQNGATLCWGSYIAAGPATASISGATIQTNASGVVTVTMPNQFCPPNGNQYFWTGSAVQTVPCGALAEQVTLSGFAESWANQTLTLTAVSGCDTTDANAGNCTSFSGTGTGVPANYGPVTESSGTQKAAPVSCNGGGGANTYCQRADIWIVKLGSAH